MFPNVVRQAKTHRQDRKVDASPKGLYRSSAFNHGRGKKKTGNIYTILLQWPYDKSDRRSGIFGFTDCRGQSV
jgi:hypothetical protein